MVGLTASEDYYYARSGALEEIIMYRYFGVNDIRPSGWLKRQLEIEMDGLGGNLDKVWPDVLESVWIGGDRDGCERVPYWLDGFIPLA